MTYASAIDDPERFKQVGAHFGMTPKRHQSGEKDVSGRISKIGDRSVRTALYEAANVILTKPAKAGALKSWAQDPAMGAWLLVPARKRPRSYLPVSLHRMLISNTPFDAGKAAMAKG